MKPIVVQLIFHLQDMRRNAINFTAYFFSTILNVVPFPGSEFFTNNSPL